MGRGSLGSTGTVRSLMSPALDWPGRRSKGRRLSVPATRSCTGSPGPWSRTPADPVETCHQYDPNRCGEKLNGQIFFMLAIRDIC